VEVRRRYGFRSQIEAVIRVCTDQCGLNGSQARSEGAQEHPFTCGLVAVCVRERDDRQLSMYQLKRQLSFKGRSPILQA
jgi:hypothetical protein